MIDSILKFIGSKWFSLFIAIGLAIAIPTTWHNVIVSRVWWTMGVFACNILGVGFAAYKFMSLSIKPKPVQSQSW